MSSSINGKVCIVTGAAQGIGRGCAIELAKVGGRIVVSDRNADGGQKTVSEIRDLGGDATFIACDVRNKAEIEALMQGAADHFGGIDVLHNNAGTHETDLAQKTAVHEMDDDIWDLVYEVNLRSIWYAVRAALPWLRDSKGASIINTASMASFTAMPVSPAYCATKGAVLMLTKAMAVDLAQFGIRVNCINPGTIKTPLLDKYFDIIEDPQVRAAALKGFTGGNLIPRMGTPEEIGKLVCYLASDDSSFTTGASHIIDGGMTVWRGSVD